VSTFGSDVRLPSHTAPPFRATQWWAWGVGANQDYAGNQGYVQFSPDDVTMCWSLEWGDNTIATFRGSNGAGRTTFAGLGAPFPCGMRGELLRVHWAALTPNVNQAPISAFQLSVYRNRSLVPGFTDLQAAFTRSVVSADGRTIIEGLGAGVLAPLHLVAGDLVDIEVRMVGLLAFTQATWRVGGWMYPDQIAGDDGSIRATQQDPRAREPLA
jgi:hypothetical protein